MCDGARDALLKNPSFHNEVHPELHPGEKPDHPVYKATVEAMEYCQNPESWKPKNRGSPLKKDVRSLLNEWYEEKCTPATNAEVKVVVAWKSFKKFCNGRISCKGGLKTKYFLPFIASGEIPFTTNGDEDFKSYKGKHQVRTDNHRNVYLQGFTLSE